MGVFKTMFSPSVTELLFFGGYHENHPFSIDAEHIEFQRHFKGDGISSSNLKEVFEDDGNSIKQQLGGKSNYDVI